MMAWCVYTSTSPSCAGKTKGKSQSHVLVGSHSNPFRAVNGTLQHNNRMFTRCLGVKQAGRPPVTVAPGFQLGGFLLEKLKAIQGPTFTHTKFFASFLG